MSGRPLYHGLLVDVGGTLLETALPVPEVYAAIGAKYGKHRTCLASWSFLMSLVDLTSLLSFQV